jgi:DNA-binding MarR family transcriptional regulator
VPPRHVEWRGYGGG